MNRVLHVVGKMHRAGQETITMNIYRALDKSKLQFDFLVHTNEKCAFDDEIEALGGRIYHIKKISAGPIRYILAIRDVVRQNGYQVVHLHTAHAAGFVVLLAAKLGGARVRIAHARNDRAKPAWLQALCRPWLVRYSTHQLACSAQAGRWMFGKAPFTVLNDAIDTARFAYDPRVRAQIREALGLGDELILGHTGRFVQQKNHPFLLEVIRAVVHRRPDCKALLVGDGKLMPQIQALCHAYALDDHILFLGSRDDVPKLLQAMDVFVFPSLFEGFGNSLTEAEAAGLPCVSSDRLPPETAVTPLVSRLSLTCSAERWADEALSLAGQRCPDGAAQLARAGYDTREQALVYTALYEDALRPRP